MLDSLFILIGLVLLVIGGEYLVRSSVALSFRLKISRMVIGLTVVSFATSAPELIVSVQAALEGLSDISLGNVTGSNIANIGLVLGITALISPLAVDRDFYRFNWPVMVFLSVALYFLLWSGGRIDQLEGLVLVVLLFLYLYFLFRRAKIQHQEKFLEDTVDLTLSKVSNFKIMIWLLIGGATLYGGSELLVHGAIDLATTLGVSERVIAVTIVAVGTSVPELAASVIAALKNEKAISLGNLLGSNIFNIASVLGITALIHPIALKSKEVLSVDMIWMIGFAVVLLPIAFIPKKLEIGRVKGLIILIAYTIFVGMAFLG